MIEDLLAARGIVVNHEGCVPVDIIFPSRDLLVSKFDDRTEAIFILGTGRKDRPVDRLLDHDDMAVVRLVDDQLVCGLKLDAADMCLGLIHEIGAPPENAGPAWVVANLIDDVVGHDIEKVHAVDKVPSALRIRSKYGPASA